MGRTRSSRSQLRYSPEWPRVAGRHPPQMPPSPSPEKTVTASPTWRIDEKGAQFMFEGWKLTGASPMLHTTVTRAGETSQVKLLSLAPCWSTGEHFLQLMCHRMPQFQDLSNAILRTLLMGLSNELVSNGTRLSCRLLICTPRRTIQFFLKHLAFVANPNLRTLR